MSVSMNYHLDAQEVQELLTTRNNLWKQNKILQAILNTVHETLLAISSDGKILFYNIAAEHLLQISPMDSELEEWWQRFEFCTPETMLPLTFDKFSLVVAGKKGEDQTQQLFAYNTFSGTLMSLTIRAVPLKDEANKVKGAIAIIHDESSPS